VIKVNVELMSHESAIKETGGIGNNIQTASIPNSKRRINYDFQSDDVLHLDCMSAFSR